MLPFSSRRQLAHQRLEPFGANEIQRFLLGGIPRCWHFILKKTVPGRQQEEKLLEGIAPQRFGFNKEGHLE